MLYPLPLDSTASLHTSSRSPEVLQTPFRADPRHRPTSAHPPDHNHVRENLLGAQPHKTRGGGNMQHLLTPCF